MLDRATLDEIDRLQRQAIAFCVVRRQLREQGVSREFIDRIVCPLGEKLGNNTPGEIAISVVSQLLKHRHAARE